MNEEKSQCPNHPNEPHLPYLAACEDAERRLKRREEQWRCGLCDRWVWSEFFIANPKGSILREGWWKREMKKERVHGSKA